MAITSLLQKLIPSTRVLQLSILLLAIPAFFWNLGLMTFIGDEAIRSLVALEMDLSGNYLTPTLNGDYYFNKPPLFNWFVLAVAQLGGGYTEWTSRLTSLFFLFAFAGSTFVFTKKFFGKNAGFLAAFMLLTSGRILIWDSMLGLIDVCFSLVVYLNFMLLYFWGKQGKWNALFVASYFLCSVAFLLKGLPALVFQAASILATLWMYGSIRKQLFSIRHIAGGALGLLPVLVYYVLYATQVSLETAFSILLDQSMQRTATHHGWYKTFIHLFTFPLEQVYHFLPWSLFILACFHPRFIQWVRSHDFIAHNFWMLVVNIPVYWISVEVYPRYLLMFIPLFNLVCWFVLEESRKTNTNWFKALHVAFAVLISLSFLLFAGIPIFDRVDALPYLIPVWAIGTAILLWASVGAWMDRGRIYLWLTLALLVVRIGLNGFVLPFRMLDDKAHFTREDATRLAEQWGESRWFIYKETETHQVARFYTTRGVQHIIYKTDTTDQPNALYLVDRNKYPDFPGMTVDSLRLENGEVLGLMKAN
jgi:4-amino-4-deoxy-L-arabinose transferase-like glycosyltransferase